MPEVTSRVDWSVLEETLSVLYKDAGPTAGQCGLGVHLRMFIVLEELRKIG